MSKIKGYKLLRYAGFTEEASKRIVDNFYEEAKMNTLVRLYYKDGGYKEYYITHRDSAGFYISTAMVNSIYKNKADDKFVVGGKIMN